MAAIRAAHFVELPEKKVTQAAGLEGEGFIERIMRQASDAKVRLLPQKINGKMKNKIK